MFATDSCWWYPRVCCLHPIGIKPFMVSSFLNLLSCSFLRKSKALWLAIFANQLLEMMDRCSAQSRPLLMQILGHINKSVADPSVLSILKIGDLLWGTPKSFESSKLLVVFIEETNSWKLHIYIYTHRASNHLLLLPESKFNNLLILNSSVTKSRRCANV